MIKLTIHITEHHVRFEGSEEITEEAMKGTSGIPLGILLLLSKYGEAYISFEHDEVFVYTGDQQTFQLTPSEVELMNRWGWFPEEEIEPEEDEDQRGEDEDLRPKFANSWGHF